jgi:predicted DNA binding protein
VLALRHGYFDTPRETTLEELAVELDISRQALSERIRRGNERLLRQSLPTPGPERD